MVKRKGVRVILALLASQILEHYAPPPPSANLAPFPNFTQTCLDAGIQSKACLVTTLDAIDYAHKQEGLGIIYLPRNWQSLTPAEQLFVITNLERTARGERPIPGLTASLDQIAETGAAQHTDPVLSPFAIAPVASIWAESEGPLASDYEWMYNDGFNGVSDTPNLACQSPTAPGCWGHRNNILAEWSRRLLANMPGAWYLAAGAAQTPANTVATLFPTTESQASDAMIVTAENQPPQYIYTWTQAVAEGAGNPKTGWNPSENWIETLLLEVGAWIRIHALDLFALFTALYFLLFRQRKRRKNTRRNT
jgi:hypothetical protein